MPFPTNAPYPLIIKSGRNLGFFVPKIFPKLWIIDILPKNALFSQFFVKWQAKIFL